MSYIAISAVQRSLTILYQVSFIVYRGFGNTLEFDDAVGRYHFFIKITILVPISICTYTYYHFLRCPSRNYR